MTTAEPLVRRSSGDHAATYIKRLIFDQHLRAGLTAITTAVRKGNDDDAAKEYEKMMRAHGDLVVALFASRGFFTGR